jgi:hypothetical protein
MEIAPVRRLQQRHCVMAGNGHSTYLIMVPVTEPLLNYGDQFPKKLRINYQV